VKSGKWQGKHGKSRNGEMSRIFVEAGAVEVEVERALTPRLS
jgi:hypothetical protein